ncbi:MAG TPA: glycosyltransferase [Longimicrobiales bacterium]|nr:glycosyltransferase [Longimicrobiales bacterium]
MVRNGWSGEPAPLPRDAARSRLGITSDAPRVGWIGRLSREKGADVFIQSLPALRSTGLRASIVGDGVERAHLASLAGELGVTDMIDWHGPIADAGAVCSAFDAFVMSSRTEGTPIVLLEAMAAGVPAVATAVGGIPAVLGTDGGLLVPSERPVELARAIQLTLTDRAAAVARAGVSLARVRSEHGMARTAAAYDGVYESAIHGLKTAHV